LVPIESAYMTSYISP